LRPSDRSACALGIGRSTGRVPYIAGESLERDSGDPPNARGRPAGLSASSPVALVTALVCVRSLPVPTANVSTAPHAIAASAAASTQSSNPRRTRTPRCRRRDGHSPYPFGRSASTSVDGLAADPMGSANAMRNGREAAAIPG
jgi:hypothetical protein